MNKMVKFKLKKYTQYDQTDQLKRMKDSDILAEKKKSNSSMNMQTLRNTAMGAGAGALVGGTLGMFRKKGTMLGGGVKGAVLGGLATGVVSALGNRQQKKENQFYNDRLEYAQRQARRREKKDWKMNMTGREGYTS